MENDIVRAIAAKMNEAEAALFAADAMATEDFRAKFDPHEIKKVEKQFDKAMKEVLDLHGALNAALATASFPRPRSGK